MEAHSREIPRWSVAGRARTQLSCLPFSTGSASEAKQGKQEGVGVSNPNRKFRKADRQGPRAQDCPFRGTFPSQNSSAMGAEGKTFHYWGPSP